MAWKFLSDNYRQVIFLAVLIGCFLPAFRPLGFPIAASAQTVKTFDFIQSLNNGDLVLVDIDYGPNAWAEIGPGVNAVVEHLFIKQLKIVFISFNVDGSAMTEKLLNDINTRGAKYGVDYVLLGYIPGDEVGMASFVQNPRRNANDYYGNSIDKLDIMKGVNAIGDFKVFIPCHITGPEAWIRQFYGKVPDIIMIISPAALSLVQPWVNSGQLYSMIPGTKGGAEYEQLLKQPGIATSIMDAMTLTLTLSMALIVVGNIVYRRERATPAKVETTRKEVP